MWRLPELGLAMSWLTRGLFRRAYRREFIQVNWRTIIRFWLGNQNMTLFTIETQLTQFVSHSQCKRDFSTHKIYSSNNHEIIILWQKSNEMCQKCHFRLPSLANAIQIVVQLSFHCLANMEMTSKLRWVSSNGHIKDFFQVRLEFIFHKKQH